MKLEFESGLIIAEATREDILAHIEAEEFAILSDGDEIYLQTRQQDAAPWEYELEYRAGGSDKHYHATDGPITLDRVTEAFLLYLAGDPAWRAGFEWERLELD